MDLDWTLVPQSDAEKQNNEGGGFGVYRVALYKQSGKNASGWH